MVCSLETVQSADKMQICIKNKNKKKNMSTGLPLLRESCTLICLICFIKKSSGNYWLSKEKTSSS